jgi:hypothetical protein
MNQHVVLSHHSHPYILPGEVAWPVHGDIVQILVALHRAVSKPI